MYAGVSSALAASHVRGGASTRSATTAAPSRGAWPGVMTGAAFGGASPAETAPRSGRALVGGARVGGVRSGSTPVGGAFGGAPREAEAPVKAVGGALGGASGKAAAQARADGGPLHTACAGPGKNRKLSGGAFGSGAKCARKTAEVALPGSGLSGTNGGAVGSGATQAGALRPGWLAASRDESCPNKSCNAGGIPGLPAVPGKATKCAPTGSPTPLGPTAEDAAA
mmetsp:Transcript_99455/g.252639  ORF Transcript_99455/g.252639 Transcript_99455/m.252639 type:complete len:225 (+) Transcript_99455:261-935(+)